MNFPAYMKQSKPFIILFHPEKDSEDHAVIANLAKQQTHNVIYAHMQIV